MGRVRNRRRASPECCMPSHCDYLGPLPFQAADAELRPGNTGTALDGIRLISARVNKVNTVAGLPLISLAEQAAGEPAAKAQAA